MSGPAAELPCGGGPKVSNPLGSLGRSPLGMLLLEKGEDVNMQGGLSGSALQAASSGGHDNIVRLLLENGAEAGVRGALKTAPS